MSAALNFQVDRAEWKKTRITESEVPSLADGEVLFRVDRFALTSNNISYAVAGDFLDYWGFFPTGEDGWGHIPAMGFGEIVDSKNDGVTPGQRFFGFFPMATHHAIPADKVDPSGFSDGSAHRGKHAPAYLQFSNTTADRLYEADREDQLMLMRGLFMTSFLADDFLADNDFHGAESVLVTSASSKTSIALAYQLAQREGVRSIGLTSPRNSDFVRSLGLYDEVCLYDDAASLAGGGQHGIVDMAGSADLTRALHEHFAERLVFDCTIGATHWDRGGPADDNLPGAKPEFFFAPAQIQKRATDWGPAELQRRLGEAWKSFSASTDAWLLIERGTGPDAMQQVYQQVLAGEAAANQGHVLSLWA